MARQRIFKDHALSGAEKKRRQDDQWASIDAAIDEAIRGINWERRNLAETSFYNFVCTYGFPSLLNTLPPQNAKLVLDKMESSLNMAKPI